MSKSVRYSPEVRERAVRMVLDHQGEHTSQWAAIGSIASKIGCAPETLRSWVRRAERDQGIRDGSISAERERPSELESEVRELIRANEILRKETAFCPFCEAETEPADDVSGCSVWEDFSVQCTRVMKEGCECRGDNRVDVTFEDTYDVDSTAFHPRIQKLCLETYLQWLNKEPKETSLLCNCGQKLTFTSGSEVEVSCQHCWKGPSPKIDDPDFVNGPKYYSRPPVSG